jgi:MFS family permease
MVAPGLPRHELVLTLLAASVWGLFNAGYIVYLSFAPRVLVSGGYGATEAAAVISIASWVMIFSIAMGGQIADRTGKRDLVFYVCSVTAVASVLLLHEVSIAVWLSLAFGLVGMASAGVIMALTGEAMAPQRRAFGMGVFFSGYFVIMTAAPPIAGWLYDRSGDPYVSVQFAAALFFMSALAHAAFRLVKRRFAE